MDAPGAYRRLHGADGVHPSAATPAGVSVTALRLLRRWRTRAECGRAGGAPKECLRVRPRPRLMAARSSLVIPGGAPGRCLREVTGPLLSGNETHCIRSRFKDAPSGRSSKRWGLKALRLGAEDRSPFFPPLLILRISTRQTVSLVCFRFNTRYISITHLLLIMFHVKQFRNEYESIKHRSRWPFKTAP